MQSCKLNPRPGCELPENRIYSHHTETLALYVVPDIEFEFMSSMNLQQQVLRTDVSGMPLEWIGYQDAVRLIALEQVSYALGRTLYKIRGGINALTGIRSAIEVNAIIATWGYPTMFLTCALLMVLATVFFAMWDRGRVVDPDQTVDTTAG